MRQISQYGWEIVSESGNILQTVALHNVYAANEYIKNYVSSFVNWSYELKTLKEEEWKNQNFQCTRKCLNLED